MGQVVTKQVLSPQSSGDHLPHGRPIMAPWAPHHRAPAPRTHDNVGTGRARQLG